MDHLMCPIVFEDQGVRRWAFGGGSLVFKQYRTFQRVSASGAALAELRRLGRFRDYCNLLGMYEHKITRCDLAVDLMADAPPILRALEAKYPDDRFNFGRKSLKVTRLYSRRERDKLLTGTWYVGHRSTARVTARVYDKQYEAFEKRNELLPPTTRYELTFRKDYGVSFWDVLMPRDLFYHHSHGVLLDADGDYAPWESRGCVPWATVARPDPLVYQQFKRRLEASPDLHHLADVAAGMGSSSKALIMRHFETLLDAAFKAADSSSKAS